MQRLTEDRRVSLLTQDGKTLQYAMGHADDLLGHGPPAPGGGNHRLAQDQAHYPNGYYTGGREPAILFGVNSRDLKGV